MSDENFTAKCSVCEAVEEPPHVVLKTLYKEGERGKYADGLICNVCEADSE